LPGEASYDLIISGLPLNNFPAAQVREIFKAYNRLLKPGGTLTYYEYVFIRQVMAPFVNRRERRRLYRVGRVVGGYIRSFQIRRQPIFINVPPAIVRTLSLKPDTAAIDRLDHQRKTTPRRPLNEVVHRKSPALYL
jgi:phosphatidylethanolamine/phosphatidyl-N-methylethanolamine N-methyltransferase